MVIFLEAVELIILINLININYNLITSLSKGLKEYDVDMNDEDDLTDLGYDFLILFTQKEILEEHHREWVEVIL